MKERMLWVHTKSSGQYQIVGFGIHEATMTPSVIYQHVETGSVWVRPCAEFFDGRFAQAFEEVRGKSVRPAARDDLEADEFEDDL